MVIIYKNPHWRLHLNNATKTRQVYKGNQLCCLPGLLTSVTEKLGDCKSLLRIYIRAKYRSSGTMCWQLHTSSNGHVQAVGGSRPQQNKSHQLTSISLRSSGFLPDD